LDLTERCYYPNRWKQHFFAKKLIIK